MLKNALNLARKDLKLFYRDRAAVIMGYLAPIIMLVIFGVIYSGMGSGGGDVKINLLWVDKEHSAKSTSFFNSLATQDVFEIQSTVDTESGIVPITEDTAKDMVLNGKAGVALVYERTKENFAMPSMGIPVMTLYYDPSSGIERNITAGLLNQALFQSFGSDLPRDGVNQMLKFSGLEGSDAGNKMLDTMNRWIGEMGTGSTEGGGDNRGSMQKMMGSMMDLTQTEVVKEQVKEGNPFMANTVSGLIVLFLLFSVSYSAASLLKEKQEGTIRRLLFAPISVDSIILGKFLAVGFNSIIQVFVMLLAAMFIFKVNIFGNFGPVLVMSISTVAAVTAFGMMLASVSKSYEQMQSMITIIVLSMSAIGGSMFPRILMPDWMKDLGFLTINGWAIDGYLDALYRFKGLGYILGYGPARSFMDGLHNSEAIVLLLLAVIFTVIAGRLFKIRLAG